MIILVMWEIYGISCYEAKLRCYQFVADGTSYGASGKSGCSYFYSEAVCTAYRESTNSYCYPTSDHYWNKLLYLELQQPMIVGAYERF